MKVLRIIAIVVLLTASLCAAIALSRVDATIGAAAGPDRQIRAIDGGAVEGVAAKAEMARQILRVHPIDGRAFRVVAQAAADPDQIRALNAIAVHRAPRDRLARAAAIDQAFAAGDVNAGIAHLDALLRVDTDVRRDMLQRLAPLLVHDEIQIALVDRLVRAPAWRPALASVLLSPSTPGEPAVRLLGRLAVRTSLLPDEVEARIALLDRLGRNSEARAAWLQSLPGDARHGADGELFDGGFERPDITGGYGWQITPQPALTVVHDDVAPLEGRYALALVFSGRAVSDMGVGQLLALAPGRYRFELGVENGTQAARAFVFELTCQGVGVPQLRLELPGTAMRWTRAAAGFDIPDAGCPGQRLRLRYSGRSLQERLVSGTLRLDAIHLNRMQNSGLR
jgi:hypothetical protein